jgi:hypothetical protein
MYLEYRDEDQINIVFSTLIINVESLNKKKILLENFGSNYNYNCVTNGKLLFFSEMNQSSMMLNEIISDLLTPLNLILNEDYAIGYEQLIYGAGNRITPLLNKSLPELEDVKWLGSKITYEGNFVWKKDINKIMINSITDHKVVSHQLCK